MSMQLTDKQNAVVIDALTEWIGNKLDMMHNASHYNFTRKDIWNLASQINSVALVLQTLGVKDALDMYSIGANEINEIADKAEYMELTK